MHFVSMVQGQCSIFDHVYRSSSLGDMLDPRFAS